MKKKHTHPITQQQQRDRKFEKKLKGSRKRENKKKGRAELSMHCSLPDFYAECFHLDSVSRGVVKGTIEWLCLCAVHTRVSIGPLTSKKGYAFFGSVRTFRAILLLRALLNRIHSVVFSKSVCSGFFFFPSFVTDSFFVRANGLTQRESLMGQRVAAVIYAWGCGPCYDPPPLFFFFEKCRYKRSHRCCTSLFFVIGIGNYLCLTFNKFLFFNNYALSLSL